MNSNALSFPEWLEARIAPAFPAVFDVATLNGANGFALSGVALRDYAGGSVSGAGDVNGDGFDDLIIGAEEVDAGFEGSGASYVVFGTGSGFPAELDLAALNGANGFRLTGVQRFDRSGHSVSAAGDVNADGFDDVIIGAGSGFYVVFGRATGFAASLSLDALDGSNGFKVSGVVIANSFHSVSAAGDVNDDGFDDVIFGSVYEPSTGGNSGAAFVLFGKAAFAANLNVSTLNGTNGFRMNGAASGDSAGISVGGGGDVNGDGFDDLIVGAFQARAAGFSSGAAYVVFGKASGFTPALNLSALNGSNGFRATGAAAGDETGRAVSNAGDVNGDGFADLIVGSAAADPNGNYSGAAHVLFGAPQFGAELSLAALNGTNGFRIAGSIATRLGSTAGAAGDINGDGFDDVVIGTYSGGQAYVVYGRALGFPASLNATALDGLNGFTMTHGNTLSAEVAVNGAGDVNRDGVHDLLIGSYIFSDEQVFSGAAWVVFGLGAVDLQLSITDGLTTIAPGAAAEYTIDYMNTGTFDAREVVISHMLPGSLSFSAAENAGWTQTGDTLTYRISVLEGGAHGTVSLRLNAVSPAAAGLTQIALTATIADNGASGVDPTPANNAATDIDVLNAAPDLAVALTDNVTSVEPGGTLTYALNYRNEGTQNATGVFLTQSLAEGANFEAAASSAGWSETAPGSALYRLNVGGLTGGETGSAVFTVRLNAPAASGQNELSSSAAIGDDAANGADLQPANNSATDINSLDAAPDFFVATEHAVLSTQTGWRIVETFDFGNGGKQDAQMVVVRATLGEEAMFNSALSTPGWVETTPGSGLFALSIGDLAGGGERSVSFTADALYPEIGGVRELRLGASISDDETNGADPSPENNETSGRIELVAPAFNKTQRQATFLDSDGDRVRVVVDRGTFSAADFTIFSINDGTRRSQINLSDDGFEFANASFTISARRAAGAAGDGIVHLGALDATGLDLASVKVGGDLGQIDAGDGDARKPAIGRLTIGSLGLRGGDTQPAGDPQPLRSEVFGELSRLKVKGAVQNAVIEINGALVKAAIGGNIDGSAGGAEAGILQVRGDIGMLFVKGDVIGGAGRTGVFSDGVIKEITIAGNLRAAEESAPVVISALGHLGVQRQAQAFALGALKVGGDVVNARVLVGYDVDLDPLNADAAIRAVEVDGSWRASSISAGVIDISNDGFGRNDALIPGGGGTPSVLARIASIKIEGVVSGSDTNPADHFGFVAEQIAKVTVAGTRHPFFGGSDSIVLDRARDDFRAADFA